MSTNLADTRVRLTSMKQSARGVSFTRAPIRWLKCIKTEIFGQSGIAFRSLAAAVTSPSATIFLLLVDQYNKLAMTSREPIDSHTPSRLPAGLDGRIDSLNHSCEPNGRASQIIHEAGDFVSAFSCDISTHT